MKVIQIYAYFSPHLGGAEQRIKDLSECLAKRGHKVEVFTSDVGCPKNKQLKSTKNLKIHYLPAKEFAHTPIIPSLYKELMKIPQNSIVHVHVAQAYVPEIIYKVWKKRRISYIAHIRMDSEPTSLLGKIILKPYQNILLKRFLQNAEKIIVLNRDYQDLMIKKYTIDKKKIVIIPNATNFKEVKLKYFSKDKKIRILAVGRLDLQKNYLNLIKSISLLPKDIKDNLTLNIVGDGPQKEELLRLIKKLDLDKNIFLRGRIEGKKLEKLYENSDLFILVSYREGFSTTLLEAMSKGLPIITTNVIGNRCTVKDDYNGYLCETNSKDIAKTIEKMIKNRRDWERFSKNNLKEVKKYSWDKIVSQTEKVYEEVLKEHNKTSKK